MEDEPAETSYEAWRASNIRRNQQFLQHLGIEPIPAPRPSSQMPAASKKSKDTTPTAPRSPRSAFPTRSSTRNQQGTYYVQDLRARCDQKTSLPATATTHQSQGLTHKTSPVEEGPSKAEPVWSFSAGVSHDGDTPQKRRWQLNHDDDDGGTSCSLSLWYDRADEPRCAPPGTGLLQFSLAVEEEDNSIPPPDRAPPRAGKAKIVSGMPQSGDQAVSKSKQPCPKASWTLNMLTGTSDEQPCTWPQDCQRDQDVQPGQSAPMLDMYLQASTWAGQQAGNRSDHNHMIIQASQLLAR